MPEPTTSGAAAAYAFGAVTITGSFLGLQFDLLMAGIAGGFVALSAMPPTSRLKMAATLVASTLVAAYGGPIAAAAAGEYLPWTLKADGDKLRLFSAFVVGVSAQTVVPMALNFVRVRLGGAIQ